MGRVVTVTIPHNLGRQQAVDRVRSGFDKFGDALGFGVKLDSRWEDDTAHFSAAALGQSVTGTVDVLDAEMVIKVELPLLLAGMADKISATLGKQGKLLLGKS